MYDFSDRRESSFNMRGYSERTVEMCPGEESISDEEALKRLRIFNSKRTTTRKFIKIPKR